MIRLLFIILFSGFYTLGFSQEMEELKTSLVEAKSDTLKLRLLVEITDACEINEIEDYANQAILLANRLLKEKKHPDKPILIHKATAINNLAFLNHMQSFTAEGVSLYLQSLKIFESVKDTDGVIMACNNVAILEKDLGHIDLTIQYLDRALDLAIKSNNKERMHFTYTNYSSIYVKMGLIQKAIDYAYKGLKIQDKIGDKYGKGYALNNIASLFYMQKDYKKAEEFFIKSLEIRSEIKDEFGISTAYNNLAKVYEAINKNDKALEYYNKCLELRLQIINREGVAQSYSNLGSFYYKLNQNDKAFEYYKKSIEIRESIEDNEGLSTSYQKMADILLRTNKVQEAEKFGLKSLEIANKLGFGGNIESSANILSEIYEKQGKYKQAYEMHKLYIQMRDSLFNSEIQKEILTKQINFEYDKKKFADSLQFAKEQEVKDLALAKQEAQLKQEKTQRIALYGGLFLILIFAGVMYNRFKVTHKQKEIIENQKELVEEKQKEILDSIRYAKRIQDALLTSQVYIERNLKRLKNNF